MSISATITKKAESIIYWNGYDRSTEVIAKDDERKLAGKNVNNYYKKLKSKDIDLDRIVWRSTV